ncbi:MAG: hypothetical protein ACREST_02265, partial [Steroidobacteraceae bacterium]
SEVAHGSTRAGNPFPFASCNLPIDTETMFAGYLGVAYAKGRGLLFLAINPGGGGDAYETRTTEDEIFYPLLVSFKSAAMKRSRRS